MTRSRTLKTILPFMLGAAAVAPTGHALAASKAARTVTHTYKGAVVTTQWGPLQATVTVKNKKIINVKIATSTHATRSAILDSQAFPTLRQEVLQAQSTRVNLVSGATQVSQAYLQSVESALVKAHLG